ncbi:MAG: hypothetical protein K2L78_08530, partial [Muribaculaceae bacterium]|nr:hypothetical protein [Muribaculaceae bacterium]
MQHAKCLILHLPRNKIMAATLKLRHLFGNEIVQIRLYGAACDLGSDTAGQRHREWRCRTRQYQAAPHPDG